MPSLRRRRRCCAPLSGVVDVVAGQPRTHVKAIAELTRRLAACLRLAVEAGELAAGADCDQLSAFFWIGWEGAVLRARLVRSTRPLDVFIAGFLARAATDH